MRSPILRDFWVQRQTQRAAVEIPFSVFRIFKFLIRVIRFIRGSQSSHFCQGCDSRIERRISWSCPIAAVRRGLRSQSRPSSPIVIVVKGDGSGTAVVLFAARPVCCSSCLLQSEGFAPRDLGLWLNQEFCGVSPFTCNLSSSISACFFLDLVM